MTDMGIRQRGRGGRNPIGRHLAFHRNGKPRGWLRRLLFRPDGRPWSLAHPIVFRRDGKVRPAFAVWQAQYAVQLNRKQLPTAVKALLSPPPDLDTLARGWQQSAIAVKLSASDELTAIIQARAVSVSRRLLLAITHDNYHNSTGGIQTCLGREEQTSLAVDVDYLVAFPRQPLPNMAAAEIDPVLGLILNRRLIGYCRTSTLASTMSALRSSRQSIDITIHQLMGHSIEGISDVLSAIGSTSCWFWVHDFFSLCPNFTLRRNNTTFCGAPDLDSASCFVCVYGKDRASHLERINAFFNRFAIHVIAPSQSALSLWQARSEFRTASEQINPHIELTWRPRTVPRSFNQEAPVRVAFIGMPVEQKGWPVFERLVRYQEDESRRYQFLVFGLPEGAQAIRRSEELQKVQHVEVNVTPSGPLAMAQALEAHEVDLIIQWPATRETFSLTTHEGLESGAYVVTHSSSGNVAAAIAAFGRGVILSDEADLLAFFATGQAVELGRKARGERAAWQASRRMSDMTLTFLAQKAMR